VREHLYLAQAKAGGRVLPPSVAAATNDLLASVRLDARPHAEVRELGHGQLRFLEIAMGLLRAPRLLLLDEPTSGLSEREMIVLAELIDSARASRIGVLAVEHHMDWVRRVSDSVIVLHNGNVLWEGQPSGFAQSDAVRTAYLGSTAE
jgi:branched-chain amino acid transport system permease protein